MRDTSPGHRHRVVFDVELSQEVSQTHGQLFVQIHHCPISMTFSTPHIAGSYGRPGAAIPIGACGAVENVSGVVGDRMPPAPIVKPDTLVDPELAT